MTQNEQIGAKMKACRQEKGLTLKQLSDMVDLSVGFLSQAERGLATISLNSLYRLATALEVDVSFFLTHRLTRKRTSLWCAAMRETACA